MWRSSLISNIAFHNGKLLIKTALFHDSISRMSRNPRFLNPPPTPYSTLLVLEIPPLSPMYVCFLGNYPPPPPGALQHC